MQNRTLIPLVGVLVAILSVACGSSKAPRKREVILTSEAVDENVGREAAQSVTTSLGLVETPELVAYVNRIGQSLARHAPRGGFDYHFAIVDQDAPNAFALPGGYIYVSRGLLILTNSEDELANVLGHEIVHVAARHAAARQAIRGMPGPFKFFAQGHIAGYSRDQEREADRLGQGLAGIAGYDPMGMAIFLKNLEFTERLHLGNSRLPGFYDTHPATTERVASAGGRARMVNWQRPAGYSEGRTSYLRRLEGLAIGMSGAEGVFHDQRFIHPDLDFTLRFPDGWETSNTHAAVGAVSPARNAQIVLEGQGPGNDAELAASQYLGNPSNANIVVERSLQVPVGKHKGFRIDGKAKAGGGWLPIAITWVARYGMVYRFTAISAPGALQRYEGAYANLMRSFKSLTPQQKNSVYENRVHIVEGHEGEDLKTLSKRSSNDWDIQTTAVFNDIFANQPLSGGEAVKISVARRYVAKRPKP
ncbi:MAG: M48 family metalloprotease [Deltaproteobacteria bacterium]|nr:M48 family metalloprotease [Deltaproteobacteria bacterium]